MNIDAFQRCFKALCLSFDLDYDKKKNRVASFYDSKLGELTEEKLLELIKKAKETLDVKPGFLPPIKKIVNLYYSTMTQKAPKPFGDQENFHDAICSICNSTGRVSLEREGYIYGGYCCTCIEGENKRINTQLGRQLGCYKKWLGKGYTLLGEVVPF